ncbi:MAG: tRNA (adenosine(37)-N6)-threonylcarbamoyltransferase complex ATPase subunit type 1 TsaE [Rickettsiales bacterium]|nr:tRNA (adenosine(37)-N6)-threonylcarbamoyltransferase complex ATPase subunit type 1 TsaE [Rickettsiales bacterium]
MKKKIASLTEMKNFAEKFAAKLKSPCLVRITGDLGAGKTEFCRAVIRELCGDKKLVVPSPTFNIVQTYQTADGGNLAHFDLYRVKSRDELEELWMFEHIKEGIVLVEWPELIADLRPAIDIMIRDAGGARREISIENRTK